MTNGEEINYILKTGMNYTLKKTRWMARQFQQLTDAESLCRLLGIQKHQLQLLAAQPHYNSFRVPKKNGTYRLVEDPEPHLKQIQKRLNTYLQAVYYLRRTAAAYGFQIAVKEDPDERNILTNARKHLGNPWMLNADFQDFFHQISYDWVYRLFQKEIFSFEEEVAGWLAKLTTYLGRLPMGAPTSPVLSNLATIDFDRSLTEMARLRNWVFTRFADDLTFSADEPFTTHDIQEVRNLAKAHGLVFNEEKFAVRSPGIRKTVTGLDLTETRVMLPPSFVEDTLAEIGKLKYLLEIHYRSGRPQTQWLDQYQQQIEGQLAFADFVLDDTDGQLQSLRLAYQTALQSLDTSEPVSWVNAAYLQRA